MPEKQEPIEKAQDLPEPEEKEEPRIGVYVCNCGGNISDVVSCANVASVLSKLPNVAVARDFMFMCSDPGQKLIADDIKEKGVNRVVVGACSLFLHEQTFRHTVERAGLNPYLYYHIGLREQDSWVHHDCPKEATEKAIRMMSAGIAMARRKEPLSPISLDAHKHALVIGAGVAGLRAALDIARRGLRVTIIEKSPFIGGHMAQWEHVFPTKEDAKTLLHGLIDEVLAHPAITILTSAQIADAKGYVGNFDVRIRQQPRGIQFNFKDIDKAIAACPVEVDDDFNFGLNKRKAIYRPYMNCQPNSYVIDWTHCTKCGECLKYAQQGAIDLDAKPVDFDIQVGSVVIATGFRPYEPFHGELGYREIPEVITLPQLERLLSKDGPTGGKLIVNGHAVRRIAMIHCVGSRQVDGVHKAQPDGNVNDYCSRVCCTATMNAAIQIRQHFPDVHVFDVYQDIRTYGRGHEDFYTEASEKQVTFLRYFAEEVPEVALADEKDEFPVLVKVKDHLTMGREMELPVDMVVLSVGMMPNHVEDLTDLFKVSPGNDRFLLEVHPKLQPVETSVTGIVLAGTAQGPMNIQESCAAAEAAASKVDILLTKPKVELEPYVAKVDYERCQGSGECVKVCPQEDAIHLETFTEDGKKVQRAVVTPANCNGCGVCVSACPNRAIDIQGWRLDEYEAMVEAITAEIPALEGA